MIYATTYTTPDGAQYPVSTSKSINSGFHSLAEVEQIIGQAGLLGKTPRMLIYADIIFSDDIEFHIDETGSTAYYHTMTDQEPNK